MSAKPRHGMHGSRAYKHWGTIIDRCHNPNSAHYRRYGARGIIVCDRWRDFVNFHADMGFRPDGMVLDRIDNDGPYSPENCRWATPKQSSNNRGNNRYVTIGEERKTLTEWCRAYGIPYDRVRNRVYVLKWPEVDALTIPLNAKRKYFLKARQQTKDIS